MGKQKEECKNQQQSKGYSNMTIEELTKICEEILNNEKLKTKHKLNSIFDPFLGRPNARKQFEEALKKEYPEWYKKEKNADN